MISSYPVKHWLSSVALGPFILVLYDLLIYRHNEMLSQIQFYFLFLFFGFCFSLPISIAYFFAFKMLVKIKTPVLAIRTILLVGAICGTLLIIKLIGGSIMIALMVSYSLAVFISSWFYTIETNDTQEI